MQTWTGPAAVPETCGYQLLNNQELICIDEERPAENSLLSYQLIAVRIIAQPVSLKGCVPRSQRASSFWQMPISASKFRRAEPTSLIAGDFSAPSRK